MRHSNQAEEEANEMYKQHFEKLENHWKQIAHEVDAYIIRYGFQCQFIFHAIIQLVSAFLLNRWNSLLGFILSSEVLFLLFITISYKHFQFISR